MLFSLHDFVMKTLKGMKDHYAEFQVREYALGWYAKGVLTDADLEEIDSWYAVEPQSEQVEQLEETEETEETEAVEEV